MASETSGSLPLHSRGGVVSGGKERLGGLRVSLASLAVTIDQIITHIAREHRKLIELLHHIDDAIAIGRVLAATILVKLKPGLGH